DPLIAYGAEDGCLAGRTKTESELLRRVVMRWELPHRLWDWTTLEEGVADFAVVRATKQDIQAYRSDDGATLYSLNPHSLDRLAQLVLAVHQVLKGLYRFMRVRPASQFQLDPQWKFLRFAEENLSRSLLLMNFSTLQFRLTQAVKHIKRQLNSVKRVFGVEGLDTISSIDSTRSSVRSDFGKDETRVELGKLLARPNY
ncbi:hypothetical protein C8R46DRAFT_873576, partial [Mycena filopes]